MERWQTRLLETAVPETEEIIVGRNESAWLRKWTFPFRPIARPVGACAFNAGRAREHERELMVRPRFIYGGPVNVKTGSFETHTRTTVPACTRGKIHLFPPPVSFALDFYKTRNVDVWTNWYMWYMWYRSVRTWNRRRPDRLIYPYAFDRFIFAAGTTSLRR